MSEEIQAQEPLMLHNPREIIASVGEWATRQPWHPKHAPDLGVVEEIGEATHAVLKNYQGIRGYNDADKFHAALKDAIGDVMVYLSHWCYLNNTYYTLLLNASQALDSLAGEGARYCIYHALTGATHILRAYVNVEVLPEAKHGMASQVAKAMQCLAAMHGWDLINDCLAPTWHKVRRRDWTKDTMSGGDAQVAAGQAAKKEEKSLKNLEGARLGDSAFTVADLTRPVRTADGCVVLTPQWLEARGYVAPSFVQMLEDQYPATTPMTTAEGETLRRSEHDSGNAEEERTTDGRN